MDTAIQSQRLLLLVCLLATPVQRGCAVTVVATIPLASVSPAATLDIRTWALTKVRSRVVFVRPTASSDTWVVDLNGPSLSPRLMLQPDPATCDIISFVLTPDSQSAVVLVNMGSGLSLQPVTLVKIPLAGGAPVTAGPVDTLITAATFLVTSDGSRPVLFANYGGQRRFVTLSLATGAITPLGSAFPSEMIVDDQMSANDTYLLYRSDTGTSQQFSLYSQPLTAGSPSRIGPARARTKV